MYYKKTLLKGILIFFFTISLLAGQINIAFAQIINLEVIIDRKVLELTVDQAYDKSLIVVEFEENISREEAEAKISEKSGRNSLTSHLEGNNYFFEKSNFKFIPVSSDSSVEAELEEYLKDPFVKSATPNYIRQLNWTDNGTTVTPSEWNATSHWNLDKIDMPEVWESQNCDTDNPSCGGESDVIVAVIDTGLAFEDYTASYKVESTAMTNVAFTKAPELSSINLWFSSDSYGGGDEDNNGVCDDRHGFDAVQFSLNLVDYPSDRMTRCTSGQAQVVKEGHPNDDHGHGTFVTNVIAALPDNASISAGVAHKLTIMPIKAINANNSGTITDVYLGILYAVDNGAQIVNLSLGGSTTSPLEEFAVNYAYQNNVMLIAASGNGGSATGIDYPARYAINYPNVLAIGSTTSSDTRASYSDYGTGISMSAPVGTGGAGNTVLQQTLTCYTNSVTPPTPPCPPQTSDFSAFSAVTAVGTSFAAPQVSAVIGLMKSNNPSLTISQIRNILFGTAQDITSTGTGYDTQTGYGNVNAFRAINYSGWGSWTQNPGFTFNSIAMATFGGKLYQAVRGTDSASSIWMRTSTDGEFDGGEGENWSNSSSDGVPQGTTKQALSFAVYNSRLYITRVGLDSKIYTAYTEDGTTWTSWTESGGSTSDGVTMASFNPGGGERLYQYVKSIFNTEIYSRYTTDGVFDNSANNERWALNPGFSPNSGDLEVFSGKLYLTVRGTDNGIYMRSTTDGNTWTAWAALSGATLDSPTLQSHAGKLYLVVAGTDQRIYTRSTTDATSWINWVELLGWTQEKVEMASFNTTLFQVVKGTDIRIYSRTNSQI